MERAWRAIPLAVAAFALAFIGWMIRMLQLAWVRNDSWGFTVTVASVVIPVFLVYLWLALHVLWGIAREGVRDTRPGDPASPGPRPGGTA
ncbi:MAG: hypothetical protein HY766_06950 [candidate division NC10 bacterium]|nr:hypothetical protein [candidate division NC10 bacterium]